MNTTWEIADVAGRMAGKLFAHEPREEWLVELRPIRHPEHSVVEVVMARSADEAVWFAFQTRNMPDNWIATAIERL